MHGTPSRAQVTVHGGVRCHEIVQRIGWVGVTAIYRYNFPYPIHSRQVSLEYLGCVNTIASTVTVSARQDARLTSLRLLSPFRPVCFAVALLFAAPAGAAPSVPAADGEAAALLVLNRLAWGPAPGDLARVMHMGVDAYIDEQLHPERIALPIALSGRIAALSPADTGVRDLVAAFRAAAKAARGDSEEGRAERRDLVKRTLRAAGELRLARATESPRQLEEVMVDFWFNHFNVYIGKGLDRVLVPTYERDSIRPHVLGRFRDLLGATAHDPAMLFYLDNWMSASPGYRPSRRAAPGAKKMSGLNENYARELMELHTLGVDGGYTQADVTDLARVFTGWTIDPRRSRVPSGFYFDADRHDTAAKRWLGQSVPVGGEAEGEWALDRLAAHPATAHHVAFKLAQAFVSDVPAAALVDRLAARFSESDGDIRAVLKTLFESDEFMAQSARPSKFKSPYRYVLSALRAAGQTVQNATPLLGALAQLGMPLYGCVTPDGYAATEAAWLNQDALAKRVAFAGTLAAGRWRTPRSAGEGPTFEMAVGEISVGAVAPGSGAAVASELAPKTAPLDADAMLATLGATIGPQTRATVAHAAPALRPALVVGSPDFMRY